MIALTGIVSDDVVRRGSGLTLCGRDSCEEVFEAR